MTTQTRARKCGTKKRHTSRHKAAAHLERLVRRGAYRGWLKTYKCRFCRCWHVGHRPGRRSV